MPTESTAHNVAQISSRATDPRQDKFLIELLAGHPVGRAAEAAGIGRSTGLRWRKDPVFAERLREGRSDLLHAGITDLHAAFEVSVSTLRAVAVDPSTKTNDKVQACRWLLEFLFKGNDQLEFDQRIAKLEEASRVDNK
jgi:hypothetical protein